MSSRRPVDEYRAELELVLESEAFQRSPKLSRLLAYLCDKYFQDEAGEIKEYSIAVDVLGRNAEFDPHHDAVVRVDVHHLRRRLREYYAGAGSAHAMQILIPNGRYTPQFVPRLDYTQPAPDEPVEPNAPEPTAEKPRTALRNWQRPAAGMALVALAGWIFAAVGHHRTPGQAEAGSSDSGGLPVLASGRPGDLRIEVGRDQGQYIDKAGETWLPDEYFSGGRTFHRDVARILRTQDPEIFETGRSGQFAYNIPLSPGTYELHLLFAETELSSDAMREFNIQMNGSTVLPLFDVASDANGVDAATEKILTDVSPAKDGFLHLAFQGNSFLNAIEIFPGAPGKMLPVRITAQDVAYRDHLGRVWMPDRYFAGGRKSASQSATILGTPDPGLFQAAHVGHFNYAIPVRNGGLYTVTLYFSENWYAPPNGTIGSRVFDVYCNGGTLLKDFDILRETQGIAHRSVVKVFHHVEPSPQGKIVLVFIPVSDYALVNAIEVDEE